MICEICHGQGLVQPTKVAVTHGVGGLVPCEECGGIGYDHCCDPKAYPDMTCQTGAAASGPAAHREEASAGS